ncbi:Fe-S cluster assembly protein IscX [Moritella sp. Urea-trap-13]|jgi:FeS assembly protein IscX|uniref:Fe-S cluster assembly protein IscX n=1 Tax=Moritella sp. Urea-trap-13 TaxID=2058327 RepID=UPI000C32C06E|nr:Fe-S cluster assembly protein IscX [Moritella sp. Urea-trap-13]PKH04653.1 Fe-S assembly protein IscX [Moritella sp. Urea-trap-13]
MALAWSDSRDIAIELFEQYPEQDPQQVRFTDLRKMIIELDDFTDDPNHCGERVLEAVLLAWIDEY